MRITRILIQLAGLASLMFQCKPSRFENALSMDKPVLHQIEASIHSIDSSSTTSKSYTYKKTEEIQVFKKNDEVVKVIRIQASTPVLKTVKYYFADGQLIASFHNELNRVKLKDKLFAEQKNYYFHEGRTIYAVNKNISSSNLDELKLQKKLSKKRFSTFIPHTMLYKDEINFLEKIKYLMDE